MTTAWKPTKAQLAAATDKTVPDIIAPNLHLLFVGINPGLYSGAVGHHFARPGNRFWPALHLGGFTSRRISPFEEQELLKSGVGVSNLVERTTARADQLSPEELSAGAKRLVRKLRRYRVRNVAFLGLTAYRTGFHRPKAAVGKQSETLGPAMVWVLPNPSGLNAHYSAADFGRLFGELREAISE